MTEIPIDALDRDTMALWQTVASNERRWLRAVAEPLALDGPAPATFTGAQMRSARAAFAVLTR